MKNLNQIDNFNSIHVDIEKGIYELNGIDISKNILLTGEESGNSLIISLRNGKWTVERDLLFINSNDEKLKENIKKRLNE